MLFLFSKQLNAMGNVTEVDYGKTNIFAKRIFKILFNMPKLGELELYQNLMLQLMLAEDGNNSMKIILFHLIKRKNLMIGEILSCAMKKKNGIHFVLNLHVDK